MVQWASRYRVTAVGTVRAVESRVLGRRMRPYLEIGEVGCHVSLGFQDIRMRSLDPGIEYT